MRLVVARDNLCGHQGSMRCERCFPNIVEMKKDGICVLEQVDDGRDFLTLVVVDGQRQRNFVLTEEDFAPWVGESWNTILAGLERYEVPPQQQDFLDQERARDEGMPGD